MTITAVAIVMMALALRGGKPAEWWVAGGVIVAVAVLGWWRGAYLTTIVRRRFALILRNRRSRRGCERSHIDASSTDVRNTVLLRVGPGPGGALPLSAIASYLDRYGIRCACIRVTSRDPGRTTWIGLTLSAADNLSALLARSHQIPLHQAAQIVRRRLADHLGELGWEVQPVDHDDVAWPRTVGEHWRGTKVDDGHLAAYRVRVDHALADTLSRIWAPTESTPTATMTWTVLEMSGDPARTAIAVGCVMLSTDEPRAGSPIDGLTAAAGNHGPALDTLNPASTQHLVWQPHPAGNLLKSLRWAAGDAQMTSV